MFCFPLPFFKNLNTEAHKAILYLLCVWLLYDIHPKVTITGGRTEKNGVRKIFEPKRQEVRDGGEI